MVFMKMKVKVTEDKLYPIFKKFMEIYFKNYKWGRDVFGTIHFIGPDGYGYIELTGKSCWVPDEFITKIRRYIPVDDSMILKLIRMYILELYGINVQIQTTWLKLTASQIGDIEPLI